MFLVHFPLLVHYTFILLFYVLCFYRCVRSLIDMQLCRHPAVQEYSVVQTLCQRLLMTSPAVELLTLWRQYIGIDNFLLALMCRWKMSSSVFYINWNQGYLLFRLKHHTCKQFKQPQHKLHRTSHNVFEREENIFMCMLHIAFIHMQSRALWKQSVYYSKTWQCFNRWSCTANTDNALNTPLVLSSSWKGSVKEANFKMLQIQVLYISLTDELL